MKNKINIKNITLKLRNDMVLSIPDIEIEAEASTEELLQLLKTIESQVSSFNTLDDLLNSTIRF